MLFSAIKLLYSELFTGANGDRADAPNIAIIATDREGSLQSAIDEAQQAQKNGIKLMAIGVGEQVSMEFPNT